ncbi:MAG: hypothetical protein E6H02_00525, partial [Bacillati bacterium ANGP1]
FGQRRANQPETAGGKEEATIRMAKQARSWRAGVVPSMGSAGDAYDNAIAEAFFATLESELLMRHRFIDRGTARRALFDYIEGWYNPDRRHSAFGYLSPAEFERRWLQPLGVVQRAVSTEMVKRSWWLGSLRIVSAPPSRHMDTPGVVRFCHIWRHRPRSTSMKFLGPQPDWRPK